MSDTNWGSIPYPRTRRRTDMCALRRLPTTLNATGSSLRAIGPRSLVRRRTLRAEPRARSARSKIRRVADRRRDTLEHGRRVPAVPAGAALPWRTPRGRCALRGSHNEALVGIIRPARSTVGEGRSSLLDVAAREEQPRWQAPCPSSLPKVVLRRVMNCCFRACYGNGRRFTRACSR